MRFRELTIADAWELTPTQHHDPRGTFLEVFQNSRFEATVGRTLPVAQVNSSVSAAGVIRGVHFSDVPPGQAKYVTCLRGAVLDVVVDIRVGSPTFGTWDAVLLDDLERRAVFIPEGLGHAFMALSDDATVTYLCSTPFAPGREHGVNPLDPELGVAWPTTDRDGRALEVRLSEKDTAAPSLHEARDTGLLPSYDEARAYVASLGA